MFDLKRPCKNCPFRKGQGELFQLHPERLEEIRNATAFQCHKTVTYYDEEEWPSDGAEFDDQWRPVKDDAKAQQCAGLMAVLHRERQDNQIMQLAQRIGGVRFDDLDPDNEAYGSWQEVMEAHS